MPSRINFVQHSTTNFPLCNDIYDYVPFPIVTYTDPAVGTENNPNKCRLVRDVTQQPPTFATNPACFTLPNQNEIAKVFIAAMRGTVQWNQTSCNKIKSHNPNSEGNKIGRTSYHNKIWKFHCPCSGSPCKAAKIASSNKTSTISSVFTTANKDGSIDIQSKNVKALQTVTTTTYGNTKKTIVKTEVTGQPTSQSTPKTRKQDESTKCNCPAKYFISQHTEDSLFEVEWNWEHSNHDPFSIHDMKRIQASGPLKAGLSEKFLAGMTWPTLCKLLRNSDLTQVSNIRSNQI